MATSTLYEFDADTASERFILDGAIPLVEPDA